MCQKFKSSKDLQFRRNCQIGVGISLLVYVLCSQASARTQNAGASIALAAIAGLALFSELMSVGLLTTRIRDEFQRILLTRSFVWATLITMGFATIWGFVELRARTAVPHLDIIWIPLMFVFLMAGAKVLIFRQYRPESE
jgi:uncharacterized membrane protein